MNFDILYEHKICINSRAPCISLFVWVCVFLLLKLMKCFYDSIYGLFFWKCKTCMCAIIMVNGKCWCDFSTHRIWPELMEKVFMLISFILYLLNLNFESKTKRKCATKKNGSASIYKNKCFLLGLESIVGL